MRPENPLLTHTMNDLCLKKTINKNRNTIRIGHLGDDLCRENVPGHLQHQVITAASAICAGCAQRSPSRRGHSHKSNDI